MKKLSIILITLLMIFSLSACSSSDNKEVVNEQSEQTEQPVENTEENTELVTPFTKVDSLEKLNQEMGFDFTVPETIDTGTLTEFLAYKDLGLSEVSWMDGEEYYAFARKINKNNIEDDVDSISGIDASFDEVVENGIYSLSKINGISYISEWEDGDYHYALVLFNGAADDVIVEISKMIK